MVKLDDSAAFASNWRVVLATDAGLGVVVAVVGVIVLVAANLAVGVVMVGAGAAYVALVGNRALRWQRLRRERDR